MFNLLYDQSNITIQKSKNHSDGKPCFDGNYFIVVANLPTGQVSNHYEMKYWNLFKIPEVDIPMEYDGYTPEEASERLEDFIKNYTTFCKPLNICSENVVNSRELQNRLDASISAMQGILESGKLGEILEISPETVAKLSIRMADALIEEINKK